MPVYLLVEDLYSANPSTVTLAKERLLTIARQSPQNRSEVIGKLLPVLDDPRTEHIQYSNAWYASAEALGDLVAVEATDTLVRHLDYTDGVAGLSLSRVPASKALIRIGKPAIHALSVALSDPEP